MRFVVGVLVWGAVSGCNGGSKVIDAKVESTTVAIGGTVFGLVGKVVLQNKGTDNLTITGDGNFEFPLRLIPGAPYEVAVLTQPSAPTQFCTVINPSGIASTTVTNVVVSCSTRAFKVGGTVSGLDGVGLVLESDGNSIWIAQNGSFVFPTPKPSGSTFNVGVKQQPKTRSQTCAVLGGSGVVSGADVQSVAVNCATDRYLVGGTVTGLVGTLVLQNNGGDDLTITTSGTSTFAFATSVPNGDNYAVSVRTAPATQNCVVSNGTGTVGPANVTTVAVACVTKTYSIGGTIGGCANGAILRNNGADPITISQPTLGSTVPFTFPTKLPVGASYNVTVQSPDGCTCDVTSGLSGMVGNADVTTVSIFCRGPFDA